MNTPHIVVGLVLLLDSNPVLIEGDLCKYKYMNVSPSLSHGTRTEPLDSKNRHEMWTIGYSSHSRLKAKCGRTGDQVWRSTHTCKHIPRHTLVPLNKRSQKPYTTEVRTRLKLSSHSLTAVLLPAFHLHKPQFSPILIRVQYLTMLVCSENYIR